MAILSGDWSIKRNGDIRHHGVDPFDDQDTFMFDCLFPLGSKVRFFNEDKTKSVLSGTITLVQYNGEEVMYEIDGKYVRREPEIFPIMHNRRTLK